MADRTPLPADAEGLLARYAVAIEVARIEWLRPGSAAGEEMLSLHLARAVLGIRAEQQPEPWSDPAEDAAASAQYAEAALARVRQMATAWEQQFPDTIRTATAVQAIRDAVGEVA